jgi:L-alanine-DL-glutamate epimerase-like enolase superfamily enzyme
MRISWERVTVHTRHPFRISRGVRAEGAVVWLRIELDGIEGWGEADPSSYYGESADSVDRALARLRPRLEAVVDPFDLEAIERDLRALLPGSASAHAAVAAALYDWIGKRLGEPLWRLWGLDPDAAPPSSFTIGMDEPEVMAAKAREATGYRILKVKLGGGEDERMLRAVRDAAPEAVLRVDANAGWTPREALEEIAMLRDFGVELVEQPVPPEDRDGLAAVHAGSALPIIADESCLIASDIPGLADRVDGINIKLAKCGGPREALRMIHTARACGLEVMLGCMLETTLGIAASAHLAPLVDYADLDGAELLRDDPFSGPHLKGGRIVLGHEPGLGVTERVPRSEG